MFESLSDKLKKSLKNLRGQGKLTPEHVDAALREIRMALLEADVNYKVAKDFVDAVRVKAEGQEVWQDLKPHEQVVKIVYDELSELMGGTYGASAYFGTLIPVPGFATMNVSFGCDPARVDTMVKVTLAEIQKLRDNGPSAADLQKDQEIERRELEVALQQNGTWTGSILTCLQLGIDPRRIAHRRERIDLLTPANLKDTFRKYFPLDRRTVITLLPEAAAGAGAGATPVTP